MEWELEIKDSSFLPKKGKPTEETVCYKIGGTYYEVSTSCGGSERLRDKMVRPVSYTHLDVYKRQGRGLSSAVRQPRCESFPGAGTRDLTISFTA